MTSYPGLKTNKEAYDFKDPARDEPGLLVHDLERGVHRFGRICKIRLSAIRLSYNLTLWRMKVVTRRAKIAGFNAFLHAWLNRRDSLLDIAVTVGNWLAWQGESYWAIMRSLTRAETSEKQLVKTQPSLSGTYVKLSDSCQRLEKNN